MSSLYKHTKILVVLILILVGNIAVAQTVVFPNDSVNKVSYSIQIDFKGAYLSGVCILVKDENIIKSSIINEFGLSLMEFVYDLNKNKVKLGYVMKSLNKWYIKRTLKNDLKNVMRAMTNGENEYINSKRKLKYRFSILSQESIVQTITEDNEVN